MCFANQVEGFRLGLRDLGYIEGTNLVISQRWAEGHYERLPDLAAELLRSNVDVILAAGSPATVLAAKTATATIPIVFAIGTDPVKAGLVASDNLPGGNVTGISFLTGDLGAKRLGLIRELTPSVAVAAMFTNPNNPNSDSVTRDAREAALSLGLQLHVLNVSADQDIDTAFAAIVQQRIGALLVSADPFFVSRRVQITALAARHAVPAIYPVRDFVTDGGLMSYGTNLTDAYRQAGIYTGRILKGEKPANLPVMQSTKFELVINLKTAKALGLSVPNSMQLLADEVIE
ncbi:MAG: ABC transporter substrate-binding protein [Pseudolabrys sp.]